MGAGLPTASGLEVWPSPFVYLSVSRKSASQFTRGWCQFLSCVLSLPVPHTTFCLVCDQLLGVVLCWQIAGEHFMFKTSGNLIVCGVTLRSPSQSRLSFRPLRSPLHKVVKEPPLHVLASHSLCNKIVPNICTQFLLRQFPFMSSHSANRNKP